MTDEINHDLERLYRLLAEGRITDDEFDLLRASLVAGSPGPSSEGPQTANRGEPARDSEPPPSEPAAESETDLADGSDGEGEVPTATPGIYVVCLVFGVVSVFIGGSVGAVAWGTVAVSLVALFGFKARGRRWMAWVGLVLGILYSLLNAYTYGHLDGLVSSVAAHGVTVESGERQSPGPPSTTNPLTTISTYPSWMTNGRRIAGTQAEGDYLDWLWDSGQFKLSNQPDGGVGLVEDGLWFCRAMDMGHDAEFAYQMRVDLWLEDMYFMVAGRPDRMDKMLGEVLTVMDSATHNLCPEYGAAFDQWVQP